MSVRRSFWSFSVVRPSVCLRIRVVVLSVGVCNVGHGPYSLVVYANVCRVALFSVPNCVVQVVVMNCGAPRMGVARNVFCYREPNSFNDRANALLYVCAYVHSP